MPIFRGPLSFRSGNNTTTVVDPRFGTGETPTQPSGWGGGGGGGGDAEGVLLSGPYADWGTAVNSALAANPVVRIASGLGDLPLRTEIVIPSRRTLEMGRGTRFSITADHELPTLLPTARKPAYAWIRPDGDASTWAEDIIIRGVSIDGSEMPTVQPSPDGTYWGIGIIYARNVLVEDCTCTTIQGQTDPTWETSCYGIGASEAEHVDFVRCRGWDNGYQNLTVYDGASHINFTDCYSGAGWRTGFQIHRNASDIRVVNLVVRQHHPAAHSSVTLHGENDTTAIRRVTFVGLDVRSTLVADGAVGNGGVQLVGPTHDLVFLGGRIRSARYGMYLWGRNHRLVGVDVEATREALRYSGRDEKPTERIAAVGCRFATSSATDPAVNYIGYTGATIDGVRLSDCDVEAAGGTGVSFDGGTETAATYTGVHLSGNRVRTTGAGMSLRGDGMAYGNDLTGTTGITGGTGFTLANNLGA